MMPTTEHIPLILIRGFGGLNVEDERQVAYQGFNDGTVYPHKRGENYIYEGLVLKYLKSHWRYHDATNVVGYYASPVVQDTELPAALKNLNPGYFSGHQVVIDPGTALQLVMTPEDPRRSLWIFRYYDLNNRRFGIYGEALVRLIDFVRDLTALKSGTKPPVNIIAHSMGGLIVREAVQVTLPDLGRRAEDCINKIVTLGTPHRGISFQGIRDWKFLDAEEELERFSVDGQANEQKNRWSWKSFSRSFPPERVLCVVGTNYRTYTERVATTLNRLFSAPQEYGWNYNRSDGLVKQSAAQLPGAPRTFIHKCHGGYDSVVTAREAFEVATRFFHGDVHARINLISAEVTRGLDRFGKKSEIFFGMSVKPRRVDFELFHQSAEAENCYGPFRTPDLSDALDEKAFGWAGPERLIYEGWFDTSRISPAGLERVTSAEQRDLVIRLDFYVGERDLLGIGFSDNVIFRKQYYLRAVAAGPESLAASLETIQMYLYDDEDFTDTAARQSLAFENGTWSFAIGGPGFTAQLGVQLERVGAVSV